MKFPKKVTSELIALFVGWMGATLLFVSAFVQYKQSVKSGQQTDSLLRTTTEQLQKTDGVLQSQNDILKKATDQLTIAQESIKKMENLLESQRELLTIQEETMKQIAGGNGMPRVLVRVTDNQDAIMYEVKIGLVNDDKYPILNVNASVMEESEIYPKRSPDPHQQAKFTEEFLKGTEKFGKTASLAPWSAHVLRTTVLQFSKPWQVYFVTVSWMKGKYDIIFRLSLKDYVPVVEILNLTHDNISVNESEREKYFLLRSDIFERAQQQKEEIESRIRFQNSQMPIFKF
ncbi:hypothetical protein [Dyadobacter sp. 676]|uniref:Uncharacterized protein n=1 Tax=Dyadobacter sp. 676 TaxID=3088362 RepID=A0AAU8FNK9_9BACT